MHHAHDGEPPVAAEVARPVNDSVVPCLPVDDDPDLPVFTGDACESAARCFLVGAGYVAPHSSCEYIVHGTREFFCLGPHLLPRSPEMKSCLRMALSLIHGHLTRIAR